MSKESLHNSTLKKIPEELLRFDRTMEWNVPHLHLSQMRLLAAAEKLKLADDIVEKLMFPKRSVIASVPIKQDNGKVRVYPGYLVTHSETLGPCQGQLRYRPTLTLGEITALAFAQTWKSALVNLPLGGAQGGVRCNPLELSQKELERITRRYTTEMVPVLGPERIVLSPGFGTDQQTMAWMMDTYSQTKGYAVRKVVTGKPLIIGGTLGQHDATGRSVVYTIIETAEKLKMEFNANVRVVIQGFGKLGRSAFRKLENMGCTIIAINDIRGGVFNNQGLNYEELYDWAAKNRGSVEGFKGGESLTNEELLTLPCEILITAATADQITDKNATKVKAKIIAEAANEAVTPEADKILDERGIFVIPEVLANAGGVVVSYFEWVQAIQSYFWQEREVYHRLYRIMRDAFHHVFDISQKEKVNMRMAALMAGVNNVAVASKARGLYP